MNKDYLEIGSCPFGESCVSVSSDIDYIQAMIHECHIYKAQLERQFADRPAGVSFSVHANPHDFGTYYDVRVNYDADDEEATDYAYRVEEETPEFWDAEAKAAREADSAIQAYLLAVRRQTVSYQEDLMAELLAGRGLLSVGAVLAGKKRR